MSPNSRFRPSLRLPAVLLAAAALMLPACSSDNDSGDATPMEVATVLSLTINSGSGMRGAEADMSFNSSLVLTSVQAVGFFSGQACETNTGSNFARLLCAGEGVSTFDAPETTWYLTFVHTSTIDPVDFIFGLECLASDSQGNTFPVACELT